MYINIVVLGISFYVGMLGVTTYNRWFRLREHQANVEKALAKDML